jgi:hypothetical protein
LRISDHYRRGLLAVGHILLGNSLMRSLSATIVFGLVIVGLALAQQTGGSGDSPKPVPKDNLELAKLFKEDQSDRMPKDGKAIDWRVVGPRDKEREARINALYQAAELHTGKDYYHAAMILQHGSEPEDYLLAHEFCVVALAKGEPMARWLAAATEDRFLMNIGRPQRFGTQYRSIGKDDPVRLYEVGPGVTDGLRKELSVPTLDEARKREAIMGKPFTGKASKGEK